MLRSVAPYCPMATIWWPVPAALPKFMCHALVPSVYWTAMAPWEGPGLSFTVGIRSRVLNVQPWLSAAATSAALGTLYQNDSGPGF